MTWNNKEKNRLTSSPNSRHHNGVERPQQGLGQSVIVSSPFLHSPWLITVIGTEGWHEAWNKSFMDWCKHAKRTWGQTITMLWVHTFFSVRWDRFPAHIWKYQDIFLGIFRQRHKDTEIYRTTYNLKLALVALRVVVWATHRVEDCWTHPRADWKVQNVNPTWNWLVQQGTSCLSMLKAVVYPQMMEILPRDFSLQYFTCGISAIRGSTYVGVVPSPIPVTIVSMVGG